MQKKSSSLSYLFVAGGTLLFYACALPIIDALSNLAQQAIANKISKLQYIMAQDQQETEEIADKINGNGPVQTIGFQIASNSCEDDEYYGKKN